VLSPDVEAALAGSRTAVQNVLLLLLLLLLACMTVEMTDSDSTAAAADGIALTPTSNQIHC
jgi:hypothetical protein